MTGWYSRSIIANEPTLQNVLAAVKEVGEAVQTLAQHMGRRFAETDEKITATVAASEHRMKDFTDRRVAEAETRLEGKIGVLVDVLEEKDVISPKEARRVLAA